MAFRRGEVVTVQFPRVERVIPKRMPEAHPAVVVSTADYEVTTGNVIVTMITTQPHSTPTDYRLLDWQAAGLRRPSTVRIKPATIVPSRVLRQIGQLSIRDLAEVEARLRLALGL